MAMETQLTNLLQSLFETDGEKFMKTATFYVMKLYKEHLEQYLSEDAVIITGGEADALASANEDQSRVVVTAINRHLTDTATIKLSDDLSKMSLVMSDIVTSDDVRAYNTYEQPERICAKHFDGVNFPEISLPAHSIVRLVFEKA